MFEGQPRKRRKTHVIEVIKPDKFSKNAHYEKTDKIHEINFLGSELVPEEDKLPL